ncbi:MAG: PAS domain-containing protein [Sphingomonadales bacterium]|nr:PAS domain-containing protein [Sphingomonadales bacterium]MDE2169160.1 PAS domain-containing protein [Sphingomonadales bacterium]
MTTPLPPDFQDARRDALVEAYAIDNQGLRQQLDSVARLAARLCQAPIALVSLLTREQQYFIGRSGLEIERAGCEGSFCRLAMEHDDGLIVPDARKDARFAQSPMVTGAPHIRFYAGFPLFAGDGLVLGSLCVIDTSPRDRLESEEIDNLRILADAAMASLERGRAAQQLASEQARMVQELALLNRRFDALAEALPQLVWSTLPDGTPDYFSGQWCRFTGAPAADSYGAGWLDFLHPEDTGTASLAWSEAVKTAEPYSVHYRLKRHDGAYRWMLARGQPVLDEAGTVIRWVGTCTDIDEQVRNGETMELMSQELSHRIKNLFTIAQGLISMAMRPHPELAEVNKALQSRLASLGRAHDLVRPRFAGGIVRRSETSLREMIETLIRPYQDEGGHRVALKGQDVVVPEGAATPLALFIHEMTTNSVKYGALGVAEGNLAITLSLTDTLEIDWHESGGPAIDGEPSSSFGLRLAALSIERQLGGQLSMNWQASGLHAIAQVPLTAVSIE